MASDAQRKANQKYYEEHRDARCAQMREKAKGRSSELRKYLMENPEEAKIYKEYIKDRNEKYVKSSREKRMKARIEAWNNDPNIKAVFTTFIQLCVMPVLDDVPESFLEMCSKLPIAYSSAEKQSPVEANAEGQEAKN